MPPSKYAQLILIREQNRMIVGENRGLFFIKSTGAALGL